MRRRVFLPSLVLMLLLLESAPILALPLEALGTMKLSAAAQGFQYEGSFLTKSDLGAVGILDVHGGFLCTAQDLLTPDPTKIAFSGGFGFTTPSALSLVFGDLSGVPGIALLIEPHLFPNTGPIASLEKQPKTIPIPFDREDADSCTVGIASQFPFGPLSVVFPFAFTPLINPGNLHGGGVLSVLRSSIGSITLGACLSGRSYDGEIADELFYGGYPSHWATYVQFSVSLFRQGFHLPILGEGEWESRLQLFCMHDGSLGQGVSFSSHVGLSIGSFSLIWDSQHLPIVLGAPGIEIPKTDTSIVRENQLGLVSTAEKATVSWIITDRVWRPSPYASDHQKRTVGMHATLDFTLGATLIGCDLRSEVSWMGDGSLKRTGSLALDFERLVEGVRIVVEPTLLFDANSKPVMKLDCSFKQSSPTGITWEATIACKARIVRIHLGALYEWEGKKVSIACDSLRKLSLTLTIGR